VMERQSAVGQFSFASLRKFHHGTAECPFSSNREKGRRRIHFLAKRINWNRREQHRRLKQEFLWTFQFWHETRSISIWSDDKGKSVCVCVCGSRGIDIKSWCWKGETCEAGWPVAYRRRPLEWNDPLLNGNNLVLLFWKADPWKLIRQSRIVETRDDWTFLGGSNTKPPHTQATLLKIIGTYCTCTHSHPVVNSFPSLRPRSIDWPPLGAHVPRQRCNTTPA
jgi:hypothetical protein